MFAESSAVAVPPDLELAVYVRALGGEAFCEWLTTLRQVTTVPVYQTRSVPGNVRYAGEDTGERTGLHVLKGWG